MFIYRGIPLQKPLAMGAFRLVQICLLAMGSINYFHWRSSRCGGFNRLRCLLLARFAIGDFRRWVWHGGVTVDMWQWAEPISYLCWGRCSTQPSRVSISQICALLL